MSNEDVDVYNLLTQQSSSVFSQHPSIHFPTISPQEYAIGFKQRYFLKSSSDRLAPIIEVTEIEFLSFKKNPFYKGVQIKWKVSGSIDTVTSNGIVEELGVSEYNYKQLNSAEMIVSGITEKLSDFFEFYKAD